MAIGEQSGPTGTWLIRLLAGLVLCLGFLIARDLAKPRRAGVSPPARTADSSLPQVPSGLPDVLPTPTSVTPVAPADEAWAKWAEEGYRQAQEGRYREAVSAYQKAALLKPGDRILEHNLAESLGGQASAWLRDRQFEQARDGFKEAIRHEDQPALEQGLGLALLKLGEEEDAISAFEGALRLDPARVASLIYLGQIYERRNEMSKALDRLEAAVHLDPGDEKLRSLYEKVKQSDSVQSKFKRQGSEHFTLFFEGRKNEDAAEEVRGVLEDAYREIGQSLSSYPDKPIAVILYSEKEFQQTAHGPAWAGGIYDGKIHLPVGEGAPERGALRGVLYHEYTHALLGQLTGAPVPTWLNEGLAETFEASANGRAFRIPSGGPLIPLEALHGSFLSMDGPKAALAYAESASAVAFLVDRGGFYRIRALLDRLSAKPFPEAFEETFFISYSEFQKEWQASLGRS